MNHSKIIYKEVMDDLLFAYKTPSDNGIFIEDRDYDGADVLLIRANDVGVKNRLEGLFVSRSLIYSYCLNYDGQPLHSSYYAQPEFWRGGWDEGDINYDLIRWV